jgi:hypothetical protein
VAALFLYLRKKDYHISAALFSLPLTAHDSTPFTLDYSRFDTNLLSGVPGEWKGTKRIRTLGGEQEMWCLTEQGLYFFLARSDKPAALPFEPR